MDLKPGSELQVFMLARGRQAVEGGERALRAGFTLFEIVISLSILAAIMAGIVFGYAQANRLAEWSSMSLAAQSYALQGLEVVRGSKWDMSANPIIDNMPAPTNGTPTNYTQQDIMDVPVSGAPYYVTNVITLQNITLPASSAKLRMVQSQCFWTFPLTGTIYTNTVIGYRAPDRP